MMKTSVKKMVGVLITASALGLGACASDGTYSSSSLGVSSSNGHDGHAAGGDRDWDGIPNVFDRDRDGDGVPNRFDSRPNNPRWR